MLGVKCWKSSPTKYRFFSLLPTGLFAIWRCISVNIKTKKPLFYRRMWPLLKNKAIPSAIPNIVGFMIFTFPKKKFS